MGSIPTRPRHLLLPLLVSLLLGPFLPGGTLGAGAAATYDSTSVGRGGGFSSPFWVMMRSAAVPGWGQLHNGKWLKGLILGGAESAFAYGIFREGRLADEAARKAEERPEEATYWQSVSGRHRSTRRDYVWWGAFTILLSIGDAYVDAHLRGFDIEFREEDAAVLLSVEVFP